MFWVDRVKWAGEDKAMGVCEWLENGQGSVEFLIKILSVMDQLALLHIRVKGVSLGVVLSHISKHPF